MNESLSQLKTYLGIGEKNADYDDILRLIISNTELQLKFKLGLVKKGSVVPYELGFVPLQVEVKRFNRLKNEGMTSFAQEGESITFNANDFDEFQSDIDDWKKQNGSGILMAMDPYRKRGVRCDF